MRIPNKDVGHSRVLIGFGVTGKLFSFVEIQVPKVAVHGMLMGVLLGDRVVVDDVVVGVFQRLPRLRHRLHQPVLGNPQQLTI